MESSSASNLPTRTARKAALALALVACVSGCASHFQTVEHRRFQEAKELRAPSQDTRLKAHYRDGRVAIFRTWAVRDGCLAGDGVLLGVDRDTLSADTVIAPLDSIVLFESDRLVPGRAQNMLTAMTVVVGVVGVYCLANPKSCFGSCPTFYADVPDGRGLVAEGFSASVSPSLEATDLDALWHVRPRGGGVVLEMKNEALETHAVRRADLLAVPRAPGERVLADAAGRFRALTDLTPPTRAAAPEGDVADLLRAPDARERTSLADSGDLAARETITLDFDAPPAGPLAIVLRSRQSLLSTYLFYHALSCLGEEAGAWLARLERGEYGGPAVLNRPGEVLGRIEVQVPDDGGWRTVGEAGETGPLALNVHMLPLPPDCEGRRVRLRLTRGHWRLDWAALATLGGVREAVRLEPSLVWRDSLADADALAALHDPERVLTTLPGDVITLFYDLPPGGGDRELFLESRGWYLEWMRRDWLARPDPAAAARLFAQPAAALRELAPAYKAVEPEMERIFWGSRYVRAAR